MIRNYIKIAWRNLGKQKSYGITNIIGFGIAVAAILLISLWVQNEVRYDNYHPNADRIYLVKNTYKYDNGNKKATEDSPHAAISHLQNEYPNIEQVAYAMRPNKVEIIHQNDVFIEPNALYVSKGWFDLFHFDFIEGNQTSFFNHIHSLIITESKAKQYFGSTDVIGKTLRWDSIDYEISGVINDIPSNSSFRFDVFMPFEDPTIKGSTNDWMYFTTMVFVQLKKDIEPLQVEKNIQYLFEKNIQWTQKGIGIQTHLLPLSELHFDKELSNTRFQLGNYQMVKIFSGLAILLLLVASINYINIAIAKATSRTKEIGTRKIIGATRKYLFIQFLIETFLNSTLSLLVALIFVYLVLPHFNNYFEITLQFDLINYHIALLVISIWCMMMFLTGVLPAVYLSSFKPVNLFRGSVVFQFGGEGIRTALLASQFVLAICMVVASITMHKQLHYIQNNAVDYNH